MLFSELYSAYFDAVAAIIVKAQTGELTEGMIPSIVDDKAFSESFITILSAIKNEEWLIINRDLKTPIQHHPFTPLSVLQRRWLKALLSDKRIALFNPDVSGLEDVDPLYLEDDFVYFDRYEDGDPFTEENYVKNFKTILEALRGKRKLWINYRNASGRERQNEYIPYQIEYSPKDDKFRLITAGKGERPIINIARIDKCSLSKQFDDDEIVPPKQIIHSVTLDIKDERNALERVMLHFSNNRKETERAEGFYRTTIWYDAESETEILIRVLSFGSLVKVISPDMFIKLVKKRLLKQKNIHLLRKSTQRRAEPLS